MSIVHQMFKMKIERLLESESKHDFPEYMRLIRKTIGFSRRFVSEHIGCCESKIAYLERGDYGSRGPDYEFIVTMANFYGIDSSIMLRKFRKHMKDLRVKKNHKESELSGISGHFENLAFA
ncbi:MAG TPA: helix-turn-helix transcriptional regulator [Nitrososphaeraceae archaeon]